MTFDNPSFDDYPVPSPHFEGDDPYLYPEAFLEPVDPTEAVPDLLPDEKVPTEYGDQLPNDGPAPLLVEISQDENLMIEGRPDESTDSELLEPGDGRSSVSADLELMVGSDDHVDDDLATPTPVPPIPAAALGVEEDSVFGQDETNQDAIAHTESDTPTNPQISTGRAVAGDSADGQDEPRLRDLVPRPRNPAQNEEPTAELPETSDNNNYLPPPGDTLSPLADGPEDRRRVIAQIQRSLGEEMDDAWDRVLDTDVTNQDLAQSMGGLYAMTGELMQAQAERDGDDDDEVMIVLSAIADDRESLESLKDQGVDISPEYFARLDVAAYHLGSDRLLEEVVKERDVARDLPHTGPLGHQPYLTALIKVLAEQDIPAEEFIAIGTLDNLSRIWLDLQYFEVRLQLDDTFVSQFFNRAVIQLLEYGPSDYANFMIIRHIENIIKHCNDLELRKSVVDRFIQMHLEEPTAPLGQDEITTEVEELLRELFPPTPLPPTTAKIRVFETLIDVAEQVLCDPDLAMDLAAKLDVAIEFEYGRLAGGLSEQAVADEIAQLNYEWHTLYNAYKGLIDVGGLMHAVSPEFREHPMHNHILGLIAYQHARNGRFEASGQALSYLRSIEARGANLNERLEAFERVLGVVRHMNELERLQPDPLDLELDPDIAQQFATTRALVSGSILLLAPQAHRVAEAIYRGSTISGPMPAPNPLYTSHQLQTLLHALEEHDAANNTNLASEVAGEILPILLQASPPFSSNDYLQYVYRLAIQTGGREVLETVFEAVKREDEQTDPVERLSMLTKLATWLTELG